MGATVATLAVVSQLETGDLVEIALLLNNPTAMVAAREAERLEASATSSFQEIGYWRRATVRALLLGG